MKNYMCNVLSSLERISFWPEGGASARNRKGQALGRMTELTVLQTLGTINVPCNISEWKNKPDWFICLLGQILSAHQSLIDTFWTNRLGEILKKQCVNTVSGLR